MLVSTVVHGARGFPAAGAPAYPPRVLTSLIRDGWCGSGLAPLVSLQDRENREHVGHVDEEFVITSRRDTS